MTRTRCRRRRDGDALVRRGLMALEGEVRCDLRTTPRRILMTQYRLRTTALDEAGCAEVHAATIDVLEKTGVEVQHDGALALLDRAGAQVDGMRVRIPAGLVDEALQAPPRSVPLTSRSGAGGLTLELSLIHISEPTRLGMLSYAV